MQVRRIIEPIAYGLVSVALWPIPLLNRLHVESAAMVALVAWFVAGVAAVARFGAGQRFRPVLVGRLAWLSVPLILLGLAAFWAPNCDWRWGVVYYMFFPPVTVMLAVAAAWALTGVRTRRPAGWLVAIGVGIAVLAPVYDLYHPQFYTYNHVFGAVLGPLYDEDLVWRWGLVAFRTLTLVWALLLWSVGTARRARSGRETAVRRRALRLGALAALAIGGAYLASGQLGFNTRTADLARAMPEVRVIDGLVLHLAPDTDEYRVRRIESEAAYRFALLRDTLAVVPATPVHVWIYPDADTRGRLTGARVTSIAPVWLRRPQVHVLDSQFEDLFGHELVHAFSREFGMPVVHASPAVGLVEGLAVALEPPDGRPDPDEQVSAVRDAHLVPDLAGAMSPWGFWGGRGAVSYTTTGSFVRYLARAYGTFPLRRAYRLADFEASYGCPADSLAAEWARALDERTWLPSDAARRVSSRFAVPSLFERPCPHYVSQSERLRRQSVAAWTAGDTLRAYRDAERAFGLASRGPAVEAHWLRMLVRQGRERVVLALIESGAVSRFSASAAVAAADAMVLDGQVDRARARYRAVRLALPVSSRESRAVLSVRRLLAGSPRALRALLVAGPVGARADTLRRLGRAPGDSDVRVGAALAEGWLLASEERFGDAARRVASVDVRQAVSDRITLGERDALELQRMAWATEWLELAGDLAGARAYADSARTFAVAIGDRLAQRFWNDQVGRLRFDPSGRPGDTL